MVHCDNVITMHHELKERKIQSLPSLGFECSKSSDGNDSSIRVFDARLYTHSGKEIS